MRENGGDDGADLAAGEFYREVHWGRAPDRWVRVRRPPGAPDALTEIGRLVELELDDGRVIEPDGEVWLAVDPAGERLQLVAEGGVEWRGRPAGVRAVVYQTVKGHEPDGDAIWHHEHAEPLPRLVSVDGQAVIDMSDSPAWVSWRGIID